MPGEKNVVKDKVARALVRLLQERDLKDITVKALIREAGVSRSGYYYHFYGVDEVSAYVMDTFLDRFRKVGELAEWDITGNPESQAIQMAIEGYGFVLDNLDVYTAIIKSDMRDTFYQRIIDLLVEINSSYDHYYRDEEGSIVRMTPRQKRFFDTQKAHAFVGTLKCWAADQFAETPEELIELTLSPMAMGYGVVFKS